MARRSLAGSAASAAKKVLGRGGAASAEGSAAKSATTKETSKKVAPAKAAAAKKASTKKATAKKATAKKATAKKATAKKATAKKAPATKSAATKKAAPKKPAKKTTAKKTTAKKTTAKKTTAKKTTPTKAPAKKATAKRAAARKAAPASLAVLPAESKWTKKELDEVVADLHVHRDKLTAQIHEAEQELAGLMKDAGDGAGHDQADIGASSFERDHEITVVNNEREMLAQVNRALARIDDGTYGVCESCGNPIGKNRLMAFPRATLCLSCKQREERR